MKAALFLSVVLASLLATQGYVATPLIGYQQGVTIQISPGASTNEPCNIFGIPTPYGYASSGPGPLFLYTPQYSGSHTLQFAFNRQQYAIYPFLAPGQTILQIDATNQTNPYITFDADRSPLGQSGAITVYLADVNSGAAYCSLQIQLTVDAQVTCAPIYGGTYSAGGGGGGQGTVPSGAGQFIIPSGTIYAPTFVRQTIIQQFTVVNNININQVTVNVNQITNTTVINNIIVVNPPTPAPVNCTTTPTNPACARTPTSNTTVVPSGQPPSSGPPRVSPPTSGPSTAPNTNLGSVPPAGQRTASPPTQSQTTQSSPPTSGPSRGPSSGTSSSG